MAKTFEDYLKKIKPLVDQRIGEIAEYKLKDQDITPMLLKGKRLRAGLLMLVFDSLAAKDQDNDTAYDLACAVELAHSASLILDDMIDEDTERRGLPTLHLKRGEKKAMLDTIGVLSIPYDILAPHGERFVRSLAQTQRSMAGAAIRELFANPDLPATKLYDIIVENKTGRLFSLAALWGCMAVRCTDCKELDEYCDYKDEMVALSNYGVYCGMAMQIADDLADLRNIMDGKKSGGLGSEMLLLRCATMDRLIKEFFTDVKNRTTDISKAKQLWSQVGVQKTLQRILDTRIHQARLCISAVKVPYIECEEMLLAAPAEIADIMIKE